MSTEPPQDEPRADQGELFDGLRGNFWAVLQEEVGMQYQKPRHLSSARKPNLAARAIYRPQENLPEGRDRGRSDRGRRPPLRPLEEQVLAPPAAQPPLSTSAPESPFAMGLDDIVLRNDDPEEEEEEEEEEDLVDPMDGIKEACTNTKHCAELGEAYSSCNDRVSSRSKTEETCSEELFDLLHCIDHCMASSLFQKLK
ncbi:cytochrome b-c1 complex subunit 6, mitochondrial-like [Penaeus japonicus]|uniref:cytochrome b-c1 complex subunit 6, mitochondrial-like n=1 Tax=Penaeus japonicus TaxID=27405 RepID=UPI001C71531E|nr:cytochrome b-c1 complex subunit 6, mitochondrial-like [Penaeus japonicus]